MIVPAYNAGTNLRKCLGALAKSDSARFEAIVVDDGSTEDIESIVAEFGYKYLRIDGPKGPAYARNRGVAAATNDIVVFIDSDVCVHSDTLSRMSTAFLEHPELAAVIGCYDEDPSAGGFVSQYKNLFHRFVHTQNAGAVSTFWSGCGAMRRDVFLRAGGFDEQRYQRPSIEDIELGTWLAQAGNRIVLDPAIQAKHLKRWTLTSLIKTDVFDRGIPWTRLMLRSSAMPETLNLRRTQRFSVVLTYLGIAAAIIGIRYPLAWLVSLAIVVAVTVLNLDLYRFFASRRGILFAVGTLPLHWLYFAYCGVSALLGFVAHYLFDVVSSPSPRRQE